MIWEFHVPFICVPFLFVFKGEFHGQHVVRHVAACCEEGIAGLEASACGIDREVVFVGVDADVEVTVGRGVGAGLETLLDESEA